MTIVARTLNVRLLGNLAIGASTKYRPLPIGGRGKEIFAYLLCHLNQEIRRDALLGLIWSEHQEERARSCLNTALWRIKKLLRQEGLAQLELHSTADTVSLYGQDVRLDMQRLKDVVQTAASHQGAPLERLPAALSAQLQEVAENYCGPFLDGLDSDWILSERERLLNLYVRSLSILMLNNAAYSRYEDALEYGRRILCIDPLRESVQRQVMWLYVLNGQRASAIRQFEECMALLRAELGIAPMEETTALYRYILGDVPTPAGPVRPGKTDVVVPGTADTTQLHSLFTNIHDQRRSVFASLIDLKG